MAKREFAALEMLLKLAPLAVRRLAILSLGPHCSAPVEERPVVADEFLIEDGHVRLCGVDVGMTEKPSDDVDRKSCADSLVTEFFDVGESRSIPWRRRPQANALLAALKDPKRGFDAVVIGEPQRAVYGNQYGLTFPVSSIMESGCGCPKSVGRSIRIPKHTIW